MGHSFASPRVSLESGSVGDGWISHLLLYPVCCKTPLFPQEGTGMSESDSNVIVISPSTCDDFREPQFPLPRMAPPPLHHIFACLSL